MSRPAGVLVVVVAVAATAGSLAGQEAGRPALMFEGNERISSKRLRRVASEEIERFLEKGSPSYLDDAAYAIQRHYVSQGHPDASVESEVSGRDGVIRIDEGRRFRLARVEFVGNESVASDVLREAFTASGRFRVRPFVRSEVTSALDDIRDLYAFQGFLDAVVYHDEIRDFETGRVHVVVRVDERDRFLVRDVRMHGVAPRRLSQLRDVVELYEGEPYFPGIGAEVRARVRRWYANHGRPRAEVTVAEEVPEKRVRNLVLNVDEGPFVVFGELLIEGLGRVRRRTIDYLSTIEPGERFEEKEIFATEGRLYESGLFRRVTLEEAEPRGDVQPIRITVEERDPFAFDVYGGYGSYERIRGGVGFSMFNLLGGGRRLEGSLQASTVSVRGELRIVDPRLLGGQRVSAARVFAEFREFPSFDLSRRGAVLGFQFPVRSSLRFDVEYQFNRSSVSDLADDLEEEDVGQVDVSSIRLAGTYDRRDDPIDPTRGYLFGVAYEWANQGIGGDVDFHRISTRARGFVPLAEGFVLALSTETRIIDPYGPTETIPIQERFFNGGAESVRSFKEFELGPQTSGEPIGGEASLTMSAELRFPIYKILRGAVFYDTGNVRPQVRDFGFDDLRSGVGPGLRAMTPIGPVRLDVGINPNPREEEDEWNVHFSVGYPF